MSQSQASEQPSGRSGGRRKFWTILLGALFVLLFIAFVAGITVRRNLLDPTLYTAALAQNDVYDRIYVDVFGDPAMQQKLSEALGIKSDLIGGETYAELVNAFSLVLPPPRMQTVTEGTFEKLTAYLSGDAPKLDANLNFGETLTADVLAERITSALMATVVEAGSKNAKGASEPAGPVDQKAITGYLDQASEGDVEALPPAALNANTADLSEAEQNSLVDAMLGPAASTVTGDTDASDTGAGVRLQMRAALAENDLTGAVTLALRERVRGRLEAAAAGFEARLASSDGLNAVEQAAQALDTKAETLIAALNTVRGYAVLVKFLLVPLAILLALLLGAIVWLNRKDLPSMLRAAGWTLAAAGGLVLCGWLLAGLWLRTAIGGALAGNPGLPAGLDAIVDDVVGTLASSIWGAVWAVALFWFVVGAILLACGYSSRLGAMLHRLLQPIWPYRAWVLGGLLAAIVVIPLLVRVLSPDARAARQACNGHVELCDRPANEVAYATTHNAMSISLYGWLWPTHDGTIKDQLEAGVRALLIDTHYPDTLQTIEAALADLSPAAQKVAQEAIDNSGRQGRTAGSYLCHMACGLGATPVADTFHDIRSFLEENPREVLFVVIQDAITPADTVAAVEGAGLDPYLYTHEQGKPWPTLRQMIDSGQRLVVMAEEESPPPAWYQNVWDNTMETPYTFIKYDDFSCAVNRGGDDKPFFLLNHWIQRGAPNRVDAATVNAYDFLLARAQQCTKERGKMPNFVAVNFYQNGDLFDVVDTLNGVQSAKTEQRPSGK